MRGVSVHHQCIDLSVCLQSVIADMAPEREGAGARARAMIKRRKRRMTQPNEPKRAGSARHLTCSISHASLVEVSKVWMMEGGLCGDSLGWFVPHHVGEQGHAVVLEARDNRLKVLGAPPWKSWLVVWQR